MKLKDRIFIKRLGELTPNQIKILDYIESSGFFSKNSKIYECWIKYIDDIDELIWCMNEYQNTTNRCVQTEKNFIMRYGHKHGPTMYQNYLINMGKGVKTALDDKKSRGERIISSRSTEYYTVRGYTEQEARKKIRSICSESGKKAGKTRSKNINDRETRPQCVEYWIKRGYDSVSAYYKVKDVQNTVA